MRHIGSGLYTIRFLKLNFLILKITTSNDGLSHGGLADVSRRVRSKNLGKYNDLVFYKHKSSSTSSNLSETRSTHRVSFLSSLVWPLSIQTQFSLDLALSFSRACAGACVGV